MADDIFAQSPDTEQQIESLKARIARLSDLLTMLDDHDRDMQFMLADAEPRPTRH